ncbi:MAG: homocysteine S-methyltransferase family protein [Clostridia bacterium]|nr:homocysteine S-methyltransferase family protein [Clostridia bacterium]MBR2908509.1 homocysteine S-methyltransferase family protein [Clostridia bacterium]
MKSSTLKSHIEAGLVYFDGGTGSVLASMGLSAGERPEVWSLTHPDEIRALHTAYFRAGANIVKTNTFGANPLHYDEATLERIVRSAVSLAREARDGTVGDGEGFIALDIGPLGVLFEPYGTMTFDKAVEAFSHVVRIGRDAGADCILIETMTDSYETKAAVLAAKENADLPVFVTNSYDAKGRLMMGASADVMVALLEGLGVDAIGMNCSTGPSAMLPTVREICKYASVPVIVNPNAGLPRVDDSGNTVYDLSPEEFAEAVREIVRAGARLIGGCCGTTPDYIRATVDRTRGMEPVPLTKKPRTVIASSKKTVEFTARRTVSIGDLLSSEGKTILKEALEAGDVDTFIELAEAQEDEDAEVISVNAGRLEPDEKTLLRDTVKELQGVTSLPLMVETDDVCAMENALRYYNGKALIGAVSGTDESMDGVFPLAKKYGGVVVALTCDENGVPDTAEERVAIAERILARAQEYGLSACDLLFDPLSENAFMAAAEAARRIRTEMGCCTTVGESSQGEAARI